MKNTKENTHILYFEEGLCLQDHHEHIYDIDPKLGAEPLGQQLLKSGAKVKKLYTSIAFYSGEADINQIIFESEEDAAIDCKANYKRAVKEGLENGDIDSYSWNDETVSGSINWEDGNQSIFEVQESNFFSSAVCNEFLCKEYDEERIQEEKNKKDGYFEIALIEKPGCEGLTKSEVTKLYDMLSTPEAFPIEIGDINGCNAAMGFITPEAAEELMYEYGQNSALGEFISSILDDSDEESEDGTYTFKDLRIWMGR